MQYLLNLVYLTILICVSPVILLRRIKYGRYRAGWKERLFGPKPLEKTGQDTVWLHAVSVGEVQVLRTLVEQFERYRPNFRLAISISTDAGIALAQKLFPKHYVFYAPIDFSWAVQRAMSSLEPKLLILAELEVWPNWISAAKRRGCPIVVVNGRLSENSFRGYQKLGPLVRKTFEKLTWVGAQSAPYAQRFEAIGVPQARIMVTGNTKFDGATGDRSVADVVQRSELLKLNQEDLVWVAGSTQAPEEELVLNVFSKLAIRYPTMKLILVPRHPERFAEVAGLIEATNQPWCRRSESPTQIHNPNWRIFLGDSVGELRWWWGVADIGFVGGSFGDRGGQNMIEPCAYGVATCFGPNTRNFSDIVKLLIDDAACQQLNSPDELLPWIESMVIDAEKRQSLGLRGQETCRKHKGAIDRTWQQILRLVEPGLHSP